MGNEFQMGVEATMARVLVHFDALKQAMRHSDREDPITVIQAIEAMINRDMNENPIRPPLEREKSQR